MVSVNVILCMRDDENSHLRSRAHSQGRAGRGVAAEVWNLFRSS